MASISDRVPLMPVPFCAQSFVPTLPLQSRRADRYKARNIRLLLQLALLSLSGLTGAQALVSQSYQGAAGNAGIKSLVTGRKLHSQGEFFTGQDELRTAGQIKSQGHNALAMLPAFADAWSPSARSLLQTSGSCHFITNGGSSLSTITSAQCVTTQFGATERYAACCVSLCVTSGSPALCTCTGYTDASVTCGTSQPIAGCCSEPGGGSQAGNGTPPLQTPSPTPPAASDTPPSTTVAPQTGAPVNPTPNPVPSSPQTPVPTGVTLPPVVPQTPVPTLRTLPPAVPLASPPTGVNTASPRPVGSSPPAQVAVNTPAPGSPSPNSASNSNSGAATKIGLAVAAPLFAVAATGLTWAAFAFRFRRTKRAIIERTIVMATERHADPALPNPKRYRIGLVQQNLRVILVRMLARWDSWTGCAQKKAFPTRGEVGIWKHAFHGKESALLLSALQHVDATFGRHDGFEGLLDRWQQEPASHSYTLSQLCDFIDDAKANDVV